MASSWQALLDLASRLEPRLARAYLEAIARLRARTDIDAIARAIADGRRWFIPTADLPLFEDAMDPVVVLLREAVAQAGQQAAGRIPDRLGLPMRFDLTNPLAVDVARQTAAGLVTRVSVETRLALQGIIARAIEDGITYTDAAKMIRGLIGLTQQSSQAVMNYRQSLMELGLKRELVQKRVAFYAAKKLRERAKTIARTEIINASTAGQIAAWRQAAERALIPGDSMMRWLTAKDERRCAVCRAMDGKQVPIGTSFPGGNPARHPRCRCSVVLVVQAVNTRRSAA